MKPTVVVVAGPTASGKTALGVGLCKALNGEVISADSMQIYRDMDIATAKPTAREMDGIPHHLIGFLPVGETFSVAKYKELCVHAIEDVLSRGKLPIIVGGTGLYIDAVVRNTVFLDFDAGDFREELERRAEEEGMDSLLAELRDVDPETAAQLSPGDKKRIIRALEVYYATGQTMTDQRRQSHIDESPYSFCVLGLTSEDRAILYERIDRRVEQMLRDGLIKEAENFFRLPQSGTAKQAIGYKELKPYFDGLCSLDEAIEKLKQETRRYAKRQLTWFRRDPDIHWMYLDKEDPASLLRHALKIIQTETGIRPQQELQDEKTVS